MKTLSPEIERLSKLAHRLADGGATPADRLEMEKCILESPDAADWLANFWRAEVEREQVISKAQRQGCEEEKIAAHVAKQARRRLFWQRVSKNCARVAAVGVVGTGVYLLWPNQSSRVDTAGQTPQKKLPTPSTVAAVVPPLKKVARHMTSMPKVLENFFLPSVNIASGTTLEEAFKAVTAQIRSHNHRSRAELASFEFALPAELKDRPVTGLAVSDIAAADALAILAAQAGTELSSTDDLGTMLTEVNDADTRTVAFSESLPAAFFRSVATTAPVQMLSFSLDDALLFTGTPDSPIHYWGKETVVEGDASTDTKMYFVPKIGTGADDLTLRHSFSWLDVARASQGDTQFPKPPPVSDATALANWGVEFAAVQEATTAWVDEHVQVAMKRSASNWSFQMPPVERQLHATLTARGYRTLQAVQKALRKPQETTLEARIAHSPLVWAGRLLSPNQPDEILSAQQTSDWLASHDADGQTQFLSARVQHQNGAAVILQPQQVEQLVRLDDFVRLNEPPTVALNWSLPTVDDFAGPGLVPLWSDQSHPATSSRQTPSIQTQATREGEVTKLDGTIIWPARDGAPESGRTETFTVYIPAGQSARLNFPARPGLDAANCEVLLRVR